MYFERCLLITVDNGALDVVIASWRLRAGPGRAGLGRVRLCSAADWAEAISSLQTAGLGSLMTDAASDASQTKGLNQLSAAFGWNQTTGNLNQNKKQLRF